MDALGVAIQQMVEALFGFLAALFSMLAGLFSDITLDDGDPE